MARLVFSYDFEQDVQNFLRGTRARNNTKPTKLQQRFIDTHGAFYDEGLVQGFLKRHLHESSFDPDSAIAHIEKAWRPVESEFFARASRIFGNPLPYDPIWVYLSTNSRCTYSIPDRYFFLYAHADYPRMISMHELLHFYTWERFHAKLIAQGVSEDEYRIVKESLTELLNVEFVDLLDGPDEGYSQHQEVRAAVRDAWMRTHDIGETVKSAVGVLRPGT